MDKKDKHPGFKGKERRKHERIRKGFILSYFDLKYPDKKIEITQLKNISLGGICFVTTRKFGLYTELGIELKTPYLAGVTYLNGIVLGSHEKMKNTLYETRLEFQPLDTEAEILIEKLINFFIEAKSILMNKINIGLIGYGTVGSGVAKMLGRRKAYIKDKFKTKFTIKTLCDIKISKNQMEGLGKTRLTKKYQDILNDPEIDVVVELIGGMHPAKEIVHGALERGKHVVTANKELIANSGKELFKLAQKKKCHLFYESSVGAGVPIIKSITEGIVGNTFDSIYGIINGTCNFILSEMTQNNYSFAEALENAQKKGFAESNPTLDINGMDSVHKLAVMVFLGFGKSIDVKDIYREGITHISHDDIEHATSLGLTIKLLAIAKKDGKKIEARVHPTLISQDHPLASINGIYNAVYMNANPLGSVLLSGEGAGQMAAASGVVSDLINLASRERDIPLPCNLYSEAPGLTMKIIDQIKTKFYIRFMVTDKPGVLSVITGILGKHGIGINSVTQKAHNPTSTVPVIMLTDYTSEKKLRMALDKIHKLPVIKSKPVAIRMEKLS